MPFRPHLYHSHPSCNFPNQLPQPAITKLLPSEYPISWCKILVYLFSRSGVLIMLLLSAFPGSIPSIILTDPRILTLLTCQSCFPCYSSVYTIAVCFVVSYCMHTTSPWFLGHLFSIFFFATYLSVVFIQSSCSREILLRAPDPLHTVELFFHFVVLSRYSISVGSFKYGDSGIVYFWMFELSGPPFVFLNEDMFSWLGRVLRHEQKLWEAISVPSHTPDDDKGSYDTVTWLLLSNILVDPEPWVP